MTLYASMLVFATYRVDLLQAMYVFMFVFRRSNVEHRGRDSNGGLIKHTSGPTLCTPASTHLPTPLPAQRPTQPIHRITSF